MADRLECRLAAIIETMLVRRAFEAQRGRDDVNSTDFGGSQMALSPQQKALRELEGDAPEYIAWNLTEWVRQVEQPGDRNGILSLFSESLKTAREGVAGNESVSNEPANGIQRKLAFRLLFAIAEMEGRELGQRNQGDRAWILDTYAECLAAVMGKRAVEVAAEAALEVPAAAG